MAEKKPSSLISSLTVDQRMLLHLLPHTEDKIKEPAPLDVCQGGIEKALNLKRGQASRSASRLKDKGLVVEALAHVKGSTRRKKVYYLTREGLVKAGALYERIGKSMIFVKDIKGNRKLLSLNETLLDFPEKLSVNEIINELNDSIEFDYLAIVRKKEKNFLADKKGMKFESEKLVDREKEVDMLSNALGDVKKSIGGNYFLVGEAGVGKSRILKEIERKANKMGFLVLKGYCLYRRDSEPYLPLIDAFGSKHLAQESGTMAGLAGLIPSQHPVSDGPLNDLPIGLVPLLESMGKDLDDSDVSLLKSRMQYFYSVLLETLSKKRPILLIFEDLHWSDRASLQIIHFLARTARNNRILLCASFRPEELVGDGEEPHPLKTMIRRVSRENLFDVLNLERLTKNQTKQMLNQIIKIDKMPISFVDLIYRESEGNPLFIEEIIKNMIETNKIIMVNDQWKIYDLEVKKIPKNITDLVILRVNNLGKDARKVLGFCSVAGFNFEFDVIKNALDIGEDKLLDLIDKIMDAQLIQEQIENNAISFRFTHKKIQEVLYSELSLVKARTIHKKIGNSMEFKFRENLEPVLYDLAHHFHLGKEHGKAIKYGIMAGNKAKNLCAFDEAMAYYETALSLYGHMDETDETLAERIELLNNLAFVSAVKLRLEKALGYTNEALVQNEKLNDEILKARTLLMIGKISLRQKSLDEVLLKFQEVLDIGLKHNDRWLQSTTYVRMGLVYRRKGEYDKAMEYLERAFKCAEGDDMAIEDAYGEFGTLEKQKGNIDKAIEYYHKALAIGEKRGDLYGMALLYNNLGTAYYSKEEWEKAIENLEKGIEISRKIGHIGQLMIGLNNAAHFINERGNQRRALEMCDEALKLAEQYNEESLFGVIYSTYGNIYHQMKNWQKSIDSYKKGLEFLKKQDMPYYIASVYYEMGLMYKDNGDEKAMTENLSQALQLFERLGDSYYPNKIKEMLNIN